MSKWYSFEELKRARTPMPLDSVTGLPDNHVITVVERVISVDNSELIQNNVRTDTVTLDLDAEYDDLNVIIIFTKPNNINVQVAYSGQPVHIPGSVMELTGSVAVSVVGLDAEGETRAVTKAAPDTFQVVASGAYTGKISQDDADLLGQILQAVSDTETAITAAETATTAATNATSQATSAATSANQAASSANTAASSANSAATRATSAAVNAENAYDTLQPYMATIDSCANILHREVGPDVVVTADDSFPAKPVEMTVYGNTVQNLWVNPSGTKKGITVTSNADGSISVSGTAEINNPNSVVITVDSYALKPSTQYTCSCDKAITFGTKYGFIIDEMHNGNVAVGHYLSSDNENTKITFTTAPNVEFVRFGISIAEGATASGTYRVMLNEGSEAQPWCPPGLNSVGQLRDDEKNLWVNPSTETKNGVILTANDDGTITLSGTNTRGLTIQKPVSGLKPNTTYYLNWDRDLPIGYFCVGINEGVAIKSSRGTFTTGSDVSNLVCAFVITGYQGTATFSGTYKVMLNEGSTAKPWVPPDSESCVQVVTAGKNILDTPDKTLSGPGYVIEQNHEFAHIAPKGGYKISFDYSGTQTSQYQVILGNKQGDSYVEHVRVTKNLVADSRNVADITSDGPFNVITFYTQGAGTYSNIQLELGSTATDYEPPNITTTPIDLQGHTLNALPDGTRDELHIDGGGNVVLVKRVAARIATEPGVVGATVDRTNYTTSNSEGSIPWDGIEDSNTGKNRTCCDKFSSFAGGERRIGYYNVSPSSVLDLLSVFSGKSDNASKTVGDDQLPITLLCACEPQTIDLGTITPPTMAAPNVTAYVADDTPAEMELDYVRDINIVVDRLEKKVADLVVTEATYV